MKMFSLFGAFWFTLKAPLRFALPTAGFWCFSNAVPQNQTYAPKCASETMC